MSRPTSQAPMAEPQQPSAAVDYTAPFQPPNSGEDVVDLQPPCVSPSIMDTALIADDSIEADDADEPPLSMLPTRTGLSEEKAQRLFEKYGLKYEPRLTGKEPESARDFRRVEKKIRVRIHYSCEECGTSFGNHRTCSQCGHRKCRDCYRNPARTAREVLGENRQRQQEHVQQAPAEPNHVMSDPMASRTPDAASNVADWSNTQPSSTEQEQLVASATVDLSHYQYVVQHRPHVGVQSLLKPRTQLVRRICHECNTHFDPANRAECQTCSHQRCKLCPYETLETPTPEPQADNQQQPTPAPTIVATVQRVYKKPRQRVRWTCDRCNALFLDRERCRECGHRKCDECIRYPPRRIPRPPDPEVVEAVEDKLSILNEPSSSTHPRPRYEI